LRGLIKEIMFYKIKQWPRQIRQGIKSLWIWFPVIWKDRQWDHIYIYQVFRHKLHLTEQLIRYHGHHLNHIQDADKIKKCVLLLDRLIEDEYHENVFKPHYKKWGEAEMNFTDSTEYPDCSVLDIKYPNVKTDKDKKLQQAQFRLKSKMEQAMKEQDLDMLFNLMKKHIQTWWD
jgi:hypothetical protein